MTYLAPLWIWWYTLSLATVALGQTDMSTIYTYRIFPTTPTTTITLTHSLSVLESVLLNDPTTTSNLINFCFKPIDPVIASHRVQNDPRTWTQSFENYTKSPSQWILIKINKGPLTATSQCTILKKQNKNNNNNNMTVKQQQNQTTIIISHVTVGILLTLQHNEHSAAGLFWQGE